MQILGLDYEKRYESDADMSSLRYGKVMIMADQDHDGSHIKGLIVSFIEYYWPELLRVPGFMRIFSTPLVKATHGTTVHQFCTMQNLLPHS